MEVIWGSILGLGLPERWLFALGTFVVHEAAFVPLNAILFLCHHRGWLDRFKIQVGGSPSSAPNASSHSSGHPFPKARLVRECIFSLCVNHLVLQIPTLYFVYPAFKYFGMRSDIASLPDAWEMARHIAIFILINDTGFYWMHRLMHTKWFYRSIHARHHRFTAPIGIASEFAHPVEQVLANQLPTILGAMLMGSHLLTFWVWLFLRIVETIEAHSGYSFPLSPFSLVPFMNGADVHDFHHSHNVDNYGSFFMFWDWAMGTNRQYQQWRRRRDQKGKAS